MDHTGKGLRPEPVTRIDKMKAEGRWPVLTDNPAPFLTDWLMEIGPAAAGGAGPLGWPDMTAWTTITGVTLSPWEARTLRRLSRAYLNQQSEARKPNCPEPRLQADVISTRKHVDAQFKSMMAALTALPSKHQETS